MKKKRGRFYKVYLIEKNLIHHVIEWTATLFSIIGSLMISLEFIYGFGIAMIGNFFWFLFAFKHKHWGLFFLSCCYFVINIIGILYRI